MTRTTLACALLVSAFAFGCDKGPTKSDKPTATTEPGATATKPTEAKTETPKTEGTKFGGGVTLTDTVAIDTILADPAAFKGKTVRIEGTVTDVCPKRGCWFELAGKEPGQVIKFKVTDGEMVFPMDAKGKHAVAQGEVAVRELTLEETKEYAEYQAKEYGKKYDPASITKPTQIVRLDGTGAVFSDKI